MDAIHYGNGGYLDMVDAMVTRARRAFPWFNTYVIWHCGHPRICRVLWWGGGTLLSSFIMLMVMERL